MSPLTMAGLAMKSLLSTLTDSGFQLKGDVCAQCFQMRNKWVKLCEMV